MADILTAGTMFPPELVSEMINLVKGKSALARLSAQSPIPFSGIKEFTFTLDKEIDLVAENGAKTKGGATVEPVTIVPVKVEYGARVSDEFVKASDAVRLNYLRSFSDGFSRKVARGLDIMAFHGVNPRTNSPATQLADKNFVNSTVSTATAEFKGTYNSLRRRRRRKRYCNGNGRRMGR